HEDCAAEAGAALAATARRDWPPATGKCAAGAVHRERAAGPAPEASRPADHTAGAAASERTAAGITAARAIPVAVLNTTRTPASARAKVSAARAIAVDSG